MREDSKQILKQAVREHRSGNLEEAERLYSEIIRTYPNNADANHNIGVIKVSNSKFLDALPYFEKAIAINSKLDQFWISYIEVLILLNDIEKVKSILAEAHRNGLNNEMYTKIYRKIEVAATKKYDKIEYKEPTKEQVKSLFTFYKSNQIDSALDEVNALLKDFPTSSMLYNVLGLINKRLGQFTSAVDAYAKAISFKSDHIEALTNLGLVLKEMGNYKGAMEAYDKAIKINPNYSLALVNKGILLQERSMLHEAIDIYEKVAQLSPKNVDVLNNMGVALTALGNSEKAIKTFKKAIKIRPDLADIHNNMGNALKDQGRTEEALQAYKEALKVRSNFSLAHLNIGNIHLEKQLFGQAVKAYNKAVKINPNYTEAHFYMGNALKESGKLKEALTAYQEALRITPDYKGVLYNLGVTYKELGKFKDATDCFDKLDTANTAALALESIYGNGDYIKFNQRLKFIAEREPANIRVAAMSAFASHQLGQDDIYPFCKDPMKYIKFSHLKNHVINFDKFILAIREEMDQITAEWEPRSKSTKGGFQTSNEIFANPGKNMKILEGIIKNELQSFFEINKGNENFIFKNWPDEINLAAWYVKILQSGHQQSHIHPAGWVSGVLYLKTVNDPEQDEGAIEFSLHGHKYPVMKSDIPKRTYQPCDGDLVLFPSSLFHSTVPVLKDAERCVIAFDLLG